MQWNIIKEENEETIAMFRKQLIILSDKRVCLRRLLYHSG